MHPSHTRTTSAGWSPASRDPVLYWIQPPAAGEQRPLPDRPLDRTDVYWQARAAIAAGADPDAVRRELQNHGYDPTRL